MSTESERPTSDADDSLGAILGGRRAAIEATLPTVAFLLAWALSGQDVLIGAIAAIALGVGLAGWGLAHGRKPRAVVLGVLGVSIAALIALYTGRAADFFVLQIVSNIVSALAWTASIVIRWPLLGVIVGTILRQRKRWRRDPALARSYRMASWVWVSQYVIRVVVFGSLWLANLPVALGLARLALSWPLVATCVAVSWWVLKRTLPPGHPGIRKPVVPDPVDRPGDGPQITGNSRSNSNGVTRER